MTPTLNILIVEDNPADAELLVRELRRAGIEPVWQRVETESDYLARLHDRIDLVISDYQLPQFDGLRALALLKERHLEIPFILVSGTIGEETAVEAMRCGATDYLLKDRLARLGPAISHAVLQSRLRRERRLSDEALRASEERFREIAEYINEVFWISNPAKTQMLYISPGYEKIWGRTCESLYAEPGTWLEAIHSADRARVLEAVQHKQALGTYDEEYRICRPDGSERRIRDRAFPVRDARGAVLRFVGVAEDVTESHRLQEQFLRAQRMEAVGTLAGGIAHDLNNILSPIQTSAGLLGDRLTDDRSQQLIRLIAKAADRGSRVVRQMLTFSRGIAGERVAVQLPHLLKEMAGIMQETFPRHITIEVKAGRDLSPVIGDATQLHQVLMNLCVNARDAMPQGGKLTVTAANEVLDDGMTRAHPPAKPGRYVCLKVADTGMGIPAENIERIFDPFFTTKGPTLGTGLGLSTALGIIRSHHGFIAVTSANARGTTFAVYLPTAPTTDEIGKPTDAGVIPSGKGETILLVDDEEFIRVAMEFLLLQYGYQVLTAADGKAALAEYYQHRDEVRLVLTDVMMPVMGGVELISQLRKEDPGLPIIATSGLADEATQVSLEGVGVSQVVSKPCSHEDLLTAIHQLLAKTK